MPWESLRLFQNANLAIGFAELAADAEAEVLEEFDFDGGMGFAQAVEVFDGQQVAFDFSVSLDHGRARGAIDHSHLPEGHAGGEGGQALAHARGQVDEHADSAVSDEE